MKTRFAIVGDQRLPPAPKLRGLCPLCGSELLAKCGAVKAWHWAHRAQLGCDPWWENETGWHCDWKNQFPEDWQEIVMFDEATGEKHIADVKTPHGMVIEFQHSVMPPDELKAREAFYRNMVWIVDGTRGPLDRDYFNISRTGSEISSNPVAYGLHWLGKSRLFANWSAATSHVYIDFGEEYVWRLIYFDEKTKKGAVGPVFRKTLIEDLNSGSPIRIMFRDPDSRGEQ